jgi:hypothetical protein
MLQHGRKHPGISNNQVSLTINRLVGRNADPNDCAESRERRRVAR